MDAFEIDFLDHVALRVKDLKVSEKWYRQVLGLKKYQLEEWGDFPIFLLAGKSGIALFPANKEHPELPQGSKNVKLDHFAFHLSIGNFEKAKAKYTRLGLTFTEQDHHYFRSVYTKDPDGHTVELTTLVVDAEKFYQ